MTFESLPQPERPARVRSVMQQRRQLDWTNISFLAVAHIVAGVGVWWAVTHFSWPTMVLALVWFALCGLGITGGYHRLFSHPTYEAAAWLRWVYLVFGAASVQNSALKWSSDHRVHHSKVDREEDPYNIRKGFWWAHIGWVLHKGDRKIERVKDLEADPLVMWQHRNYVAIATVFGVVLPTALGALWGDAIGALLIAGFLRLVVQYHATFAVNSLAHYLGSQPYDKTTSARDSFITALVTLGEGYHNFHHRFQNDYRNGVRAWQLDPTKWFVWTMSKVGVTKNLRRTPQEKIDQALAAQRAA